MPRIESVRQPRQKPDKSERVTAAADHTMSELTTEPGATQQDDRKSQVPGTDCCAGGECNCTLVLAPAQCTLLQRGHQTDYLL
jgi:hypothetical protein